MLSSSVRENPLSTFGGDVGTESYALVRRYLEGSQRPPQDAVRIEELLNYFTYGYPPPQGDIPFTATLEVAGCPWTPEHRLARIGIRAASDVNVQMEFNPAQVVAYRLIGYEGLSASEAIDIRDRKEAGEIKAGHTVTALYELVLAHKELLPLAMLETRKDQPKREMLREKETQQPSEPLPGEVEARAPGSTAAVPAPALVPALKVAPPSEPRKLLIAPVPASPLGDEPEAQTATPQLLPAHDPQPRCPKQTPALPDESGRNSCCLTPG